MRRRTWYLLLALAACRARPAPVSTVHDAGSGDATAHAYGSEYPIQKLQAGTGIGIATSGITTTISNTSTANVSSVTGGTSISCSPTTGAVTCSYTGASGGVTSVSGSGLVSCSPTTGAVTCSATTPVSLANGGTGSNLSSACTTSTQVVQPNGIGGLGCVSTLGAASGGTGLASPSAGALLVSNGASAMTLLTGATNATPVYNGSTWTTSPGQTSVYSSVSSAGAGVSVSAAFTTIVTTSITVGTGQVVLAMADLECTTAVANQSYQYRIDVDTGTADSVTQKIGGIGNTSAAPGGALTYRVTGLSAASHTFKLQAQQIITQAGESCGGSLLLQTMPN